MKISACACVRLLGLLLALGMSSWNAQADDAVIDVSQQPDVVSLASHFAVLEDAGRNLSLADVRRPEMSKRFKRDAQRDSDLNFGYTTAAIWLRLQLRNSGDHPEERLLELAYWGYSNLQFHAPSADGRYTSLTTGSMLPFDTRPYPNRYFVFPVSVPPHAEQTIYLRVNSISAPLPARLWQPTAFHRYERDDYMTQAAYFGIAVAMFMFNLFLFSVLRDRVYLWYLAALSCMALTMADQNGLAKEFLWPNALAWTRVSLNIGYSLSIAMLMMFMQRMLDTVRAAPRLDRLIRLLVGAHLLSLLPLAIDPDRFAQSATWLYLAAAIAILSTGIYCAFQRVRTAYFFVAAFSLMLVGGALFALRALTLLPTNALTSGALQIGSALEMIVLALALADRFFQIRLENIRVQKEALAAQGRLVDVLQSSERQLEQRVDERTRELSATLSRLRTAQARLIDSERRATAGERTALDALAAQQQFIAMVSHEFRSPLAVIDNAAQLLAMKLSGQAEGRAAALAAKICRGTARLAQFLDTCLTQDRLRSAGLLLQATAVDVAALADGARDNAQLVADQHRVVTELQPDLPPLQGDVQLLRILLANLLSNAIKYSAPGTEIRLRVTYADDTHKFEVIDHGLGIPAEELPHLFEKYRRGRLAMTKPGAGLGLALSLQIVDLHGGRIRIDSTEGSGTRVVLEFPVESPAVAGTSQPTAMNAILTP